MEVLLLYLFIALFVSFLCSILEAALLSTNPSYIEAKAKEGKKYAKGLKEFKLNIDLPLAAILTLNTFAHTIGAAGVGAQAEKLWGNEYLSLVSILLTIAILLISEIIPKTLGANYWRSLAPFTWISLKVLIYSPLYPLILLSKQITRWLNRNKDVPVLNRAEFQAMAELGMKEGIFWKEESRILRNLMKFNRIQVKSIMTPRTVIVSAPEEQSLKEFYDGYEEIRFSRIPIYQENADNITGYVLKDEVLEEIIDNKGEQPLSSIRRKIQIVNEQLPIVRLFQKLIETKEHVAMVVGEYGELTGIVTMEDTIETLIGIEIMDELDNVEDMQAQARKNWERRAKKLGLIK
jgi:CBS domain containing-hemolysin-like protein